MLLVVLLVCCVCNSFADVTSSLDGRPSAVAKECTVQIQKLVLSHLNNVVATRLLDLVDGLRSSCIGSLLVLEYFVYFQSRIIIYCY